MSTKTAKENLVEKHVTYTLLKDGQFFIVENVPRVSMRRQASSSSHRRLSNICKKSSLSIKNPCALLKRQCSSLPDRNWQESFTIRCAENIVRRTFV